MSDTSSVSGSGGGADAAASSMSAAPSAASEGHAPSGDLATGSGSLPSVNPADGANPGSSPGAATEGNPPSHAQTPGTEGARLAESATPASVLNGPTLADTMLGQGAVPTAAALPADPAHGFAGSPEIGAAAHRDEDLGIAASAQSAVDRRDWNAQSEIAARLMMESAVGPLSAQKKEALEIIANNPQSNERLQVQVYGKAASDPVRDTSAFWKSAAGFASDSDGSGLYHSHTVGVEDKLSIGAGLKGEATRYGQYTVRDAIYGSPPTSGVLDPNSASVGMKGEVFRDVGGVKAGGGLDVNSSSGAQVIAKVEAKVSDNLKFGVEASATLRHPFDNVTNQSAVNLAKDALWNDWLEGYRDSVYQFFGAQTPREALATSRADRPQ